MAVPDNSRQQLSFDELGVSLHDVTFVVLDLETTGSRGRYDSITEIAAVKVKGGEVLGEFSTLVNPECDIPPAIVSITGITDSMVAEAPRLDGVLPSFLEFAAGCVLVAHNAPFDIGFLRGGCERLELPWPKPTVLCTVQLARRVLGKNDTPNNKLATLARVLHARTTPSHRALDDARATVDVLHGLLERAGPWGVHSLEELLEFLPAVTSQQRRKRGLADALPNAPGVYLFRGPNEEVLYVGTAGNLRKRVQQYFTAGERRGRVKEMVALAERVDHVECAHSLEAEVRELRLLGTHQPPYNRRSKFPNRAWWVVLTDEAFPRLSIVRKPRVRSLGPFRSRRKAEEAVKALQESTTLRRCTQRIPAGDQRGSPCALYEMELCGAPCAGHQDVEQYAPQVVAVSELMDGAGDGVLEHLRESIDRFATTQRFEEAAARRDLLAGLVRSVDRGQRLAALARIPELVAARPDGSGGWCFAVVRHGRLAAAGTARHGTPPMPVVDALRASAETVLPGDGPLAGVPTDEIHVVHRWLTAGDARMVHCHEPWSEPAGAAGKWRSWVDRATTARDPYPED
ncbi:DNA polymerase-3 subunit epsilon [Saccharopolyspora lacisalsi]|uniref:DNA polymerase-3 subunit epsilon n=1 Tax=Halosaccharopolyspora lacisalsi TaxID=1000566 RepID=A0A839E1J0_9PSEU|nr:DEDD exonuclease domain-containing protein [Halosaccharopolyspora lacisalsi]MBA8825617.1 DNA polymerase-3 subunit epsilon [Halosaccharopolyspora lacisalsi]